jgi:hypothetical protein
LAALLFLAYHGFSHVPGIFCDGEILLYAIFLINSMIISTRPTTIDAMTGLINNQKITFDTPENGLRISKSASHWLHCTLVFRLALKNRSAHRPPARKTSQLKELRS